MALLSESWSETVHGKGRTLKNEESPVATDIRKSNASAVAGSAPK